MDIGAVWQTAREVGNRKRIHCRNEAMSYNNPQDLNRFLIELVHTLVSVIEHKDKFLKGHSDRVANLSRAFANSLDLPEKNGLDTIYFAGLLHDIGMVYLPMEIIRKPGQLSRSETMLVRQHPVISESILSHLSMIRNVMPMIRHHHEHVDGSGYPDGLRGEEIPLGARIIHLVDSYDTMVSSRAHRKALTPAEALKKIRTGAGKRYDRSIVHPFVAFVENNPSLVSSQTAAKQSEEPRREQSPQEIILGIIERFKNGDIELPVLPNIVFEIDRVASDPRSTMDDLVQIVEKDAVISLRLISVANSAIYRGFEEIRTLKQAIPRLGISETRNVIQAIASRGLYETDNKIFKEMMEKLWLHSLACAYGAREIAQHLNLNEPDKFFFLGLIHDIGKVLLFKAISQISGGGNGMDMDSFVGSIQKMHCSFGAALMRRWKFDTEYVRVATLHEGPEFSEHTEREILAVNLANMLTRPLGYSLFEEQIDPAEMQSTSFLGLDPELLNVIQGKVGGLMEEAAAIF